MVRMKTATKIITIPTISKNVKCVPTHRKEKKLAAIGSIQQTRLALTGPIWLTPVRKAVKPKTVPMIISPLKVRTVSTLMVGT